MGYSRDYMNLPLRIDTLILTGMFSKLAGGHPVNMAKIRALRALCDGYGIPVCLDATHMAGNAFFIQEKDNLVRIGSWLAVDDERVAEKACHLMERGIVSAGSDPGTGDHRYSAGSDAVDHSPACLHPEAHMNLVAESVKMVYNADWEPRE